jgi:hypothetical protein
MILTQYLLVGLSLIHKPSRDIPKARPKEIIIADMITIMIVAPISCLSFLWNKALLKTRLSLAQNERAIICKRVDGIKRNFVPASNGFVPRIVENARLRLPLRNVDISV